MYPKNTLIPYLIYSDDFAINNPLGSKSNRHSMCNFYYCFPCLPQKSSNLGEVFLAASIRSPDMKLYGNECLKPLVEALKNLEINGIIINTKDGTKKVHFIMGSLLGDNLGLGP